jgi:hypothetical protein
MDAHFGCHGLECNLVSQYRSSFTFQQQTTFVLTLKRPVRIRVFFCECATMSLRRKNRMMLYSYNDRSSEPLYNGSSIATKIGRIDVSSLCKNGRKLFTIC